MSHCPQCADLLAENARLREDAERLAPYIEGLEGELCNRLCECSFSGERQVTGEHGNRCEWPRALERIAARSPNRGTPE